MAELPGLDSSDVDIFDDNIVLTGKAIDSGVVTKASELVQSITGIETIDNRIELSYNISDRVRGAADRVGERAEQWLAYLPLLPIAAAIVAAGMLLSWLIGKWRWPFMHMVSNPFLRDITQKLTQIVCLVVSILFALEVLDAMALVGGVLGAAGVAGIAIGFAFRDLVENYIASILLSIRQPFSPRDHVLIDGHEGLVTRLTTRSTVLTTFDGNVVRIPNATVFKSTIMNYTSNPERRFDFTVGVGYDVDLEKALSVGVNVLKHNEGVMTSPPPFAKITELGDSSITVHLFGWVDQAKHDFGRVRSQAMQAVKAEYDRLDIDMPEPIYSIKVLGEKIKTLVRDLSEHNENAHQGENRDTGSVSVRHRVPFTATSPADIMKDTTIERLADQNELDGEGKNLLKPTESEQVRESATAT
ncbi:MAG: mechanosensitive ion channel family protein [Phycisphaeraceae bacterium]|nr:mechanosensitive ion channel family protein [Phycisphaerales bacterium]MCB9859241.1 mechanosensitive ion channel family protein [Phycisphaeraceae bacterium]